MRPFTLYHLCAESISVQQEKLVSIISAIVQPEMIYLLGASRYRRRSESIFCDDAPTSQHTSDYYLLILLSNFMGKEAYEWQDQIEHHCSSVMPVTTIALKTSHFNEWLTTGHAFAKHVYEKAVPIFTAGNIVLSAPPAGLNLAEAEIPDKFYTEGLNRAKEFFAGAELFREREQYPLAAFMLHQSAEQALRTILKLGTGYYSCTHNLDRLIRYASMVSYQLPDIFPRKSDKDKQLFKLLQNAYSDSRYTEDYKINIQQLLFLMDKVSGMLRVLDDFKK